MIFTRGAPLKLIKKIHKQRIKDVTNIGDPVPPLLRLLLSGPKGHLKAVLECPAQLVGGGGLPGSRRRLGGWEVRLRHLRVSGRRAVATSLLHITNNKEMNADDRFLTGRPAHLENSTPEKHKTRI